MSNGPLVYVARIAPGPKAVSDALAACRRFRETGALGDAGDRLAIIVEELVFNLIDYGHLRPYDVIDITFVREDDGVRLVLIDDAEPFDPRTAPADHDAIPERGGGAGLALVRAWSRIERYEREDGRNRLELVLPIDC